MTQEEKQLLLVDLCVRLPYRLKVKCEKYPFPVTVLYAGDINEVKFKETGGIEHIDVIKPYLRSMSSMTEEEKKEYDEISGQVKTFYGREAESHECAKLTDWLNKNHFDYRGLIPMGLALEAPEEMYKIE